MDGLCFPRSSNNSTSLMHLATGIIESFIPGYEDVARYMTETFGFDFNIFVSAAAHIVTLLAALGFLWSRCRTVGLDYVMSSIHFDERDEMFTTILNWLAEQNVGKSATKLKPASNQPRQKQIEELEDDDGFDASELFHAGRWSTKSIPLYELFFGRYRFWRGCRLFILERQRREKVARYADEENIVLKTLGWSTEPIKELLKAIKTWEFEQEESKTIVWSPQSKDVRRYQGAWRRVASRPTRNINTVVLDAQQRAGLIADMNEYLQPRSYRWYASRGIPYRRGYLFHGPPGTGKSSLSFALAGLFGLDVYIISLLDPQITESDLSALFSSLPQRCIVLLEDIDSAGLERDQGSSKNKKDGGKRDYSEHTESITLPDEELTGGISLSGFLNAIDGVASQEGRILVMTTNFPEQLDPALIRPGRIDNQIAFTLAKKDQMREMFLQIYWNETDPLETITYDINELEKLADQFVGAIKEDTFSPAEIQNFLILKRKDPHQAVQDVDAWKCEVLKAKESGSNVVTGIER
ncbi:P-loop containing nucleoside triphosphate hydrolase protein [Zopfia rhizophila CBS 207.26]|uniref:P-loop containing nucleoside triphosphate hydrolase protein n=1 Tax=Zopfia rhizophila CBS 207.26 TaxID=1314779 RepID=A0A6A6D5G1_9PEZI|nr:P-loop containing nucleoside triphosphate hydrolase protein [Zopfia rhizophila CBS 207.26]